MALAISDMFDHSGILNNKKLEQISKKIKIYFEDNNNGDMDPVMVWDALKATIKGKLISQLNLRKILRNNIKNL